jgi:peroxiredoxin
MMKAWGGKGAKGAMIETKRVIAGVRTVTAPGWLRAGIVAVALIAILIAMAIRVSAPTDASARALIGKPAPDFTLPGATSPGVIPQTVSLTEQRGHPVALVFFFTLCTHCQQQLRTVHAAAAPYAERGVVSYAINTPAESLDVLTNYSSRFDFDPIILRDSRSTVAGAYGVQLYPSTVLIDSMGIVRAVWTGETDVDAINRALRDVVTP